MNYSLFVLVNNSVDGCGMVCGSIDARCILADPAPIVPVQTQRGARPGAQGGARGGVANRVLPDGL